MLSFLRIRMWMYSGFLLLALCLAVFESTAQNNIMVRNVEWTKDRGKIVVSYDLFGPTGASAKIQLELRRRLDPNFLHIPTTVFGDVGPGILVGHQRQIEWDPRTEIVGTIDSMEYYFDVTIQQSIDTKTFSLAVECASLGYGESSVGDSVTNYRTKSKFSPSSLSFLFRLSGPIVAYVTGYMLESSFKETNDANLNNDLLKTPFRKRLWGNYLLYGGGGGLGVQYSVFKLSAQYVAIVNQSETNLSPTGAILVGGDVTLWGRITVGAQANVLLDAGVIDRSQRKTVGNDYGITRLPPGDLVIGNLKIGIVL